MDFGFSDEQQAIKETAREMLASRCPLSKVREAAESRSYPDDLWSEIRELGWPGIAVAEEHGGQGLGVVELAILCEELGYACAPTPFLSNVVAGLFLAAAGSESEAAERLPGVASGERRGAAELTAPGEDPLVADADGSAFMVLSNGSGARLVDTDGAELEPVELIDATRAYARVSAHGG